MTSAEIDKRISSSSRRRAEGLSVDDVGGAAERVGVDVIGVPPRREGRSASCAPAVGGEEPGYALGSCEASG